MIYADPAGKVRCNRQHCLESNVREFRLEDSGDHKKVICASCGMYVKFASKAEFERFHGRTDTESEERLVRENAMETLKRIEFKLDVLLDHFQLSRR